jgi:hypothetical protein
LEGPLWPHRRLADRWPRPRSVGPRQPAESEWLAGAEDAASAVSRGVSLSWVRDCASGRDGLPDRTSCSKDWVARRNSFIARPSAWPSSGSRLGPKTTRATKSTSKMSHQRSRPNTTRASWRSGRTGRSIAPGQFGPSPAADPCQVPRLGSRSGCYHLEPGSEARYHRLHIGQLMP